MLALLALGYGLLLTTLVVTAPFGAAPDELDHYLRAISVGRGELVGDKTNEPTAPRPAQPECCAPGNASALAWVQLGNRLVTLPAALDPATLPCSEVLALPRYDCGEPVASGSISDVTTMGTIEPTGYVLPGAAARVASSARGALLLERFAAAGVGLVLLLLAAAAARDGWLLAGVATAAMPAALFTWASPSPNGLEVGGALAFMTGVLCLAQSRRSRAAWVAAIVGGIALAAARSLGPVWLVVGCGLAWLCVPWPPRTYVWRAVLPPALVAGTTVVWEALVQPHVRFDVTFFREQAPLAAGDSGRIARELVGVLSPQLVRLPLVSYVLAAVGLACLVAVAARSRRWPAALAAVGVLFAASVLVGAAVLRQNGFAVQGRHVYAGFVIVVLCLAALARGEPRRLHAIAVVAIAGLLATATLAAVAVFVRGTYGTVVQPVGTSTLVRVVTTRPGWAAVVLIGSALVGAGLLSSRAAPAQYE